MQGAAALTVPLTVDVGIGPNWREAKSVNLDARARHHPAQRSSDFTPAHRRGRAQGSLPAAAVRPHRVSGRRQRARSAARPHAEGFRHRHLGAPVSGEAAVPELLDHRPPLSSRAREVRAEGHRGRDIPPPDSRRHGRRARRRCRRCRRPRALPWTMPIC